MSGFLYMFGQMAASMLFALLSGHQAEKRNGLMAGLCAWASVALIIGAAVAHFGSGGKP